MNNRNCRIAVKDLQLWMHLGWGDEERSQQQEIRVSFELIFGSSPKSCWTDELSDTVCYAKISEAILSHCTTHSYKTVEHLGMALYETIRRTVAGEIQIKLSVQKVKPPIDGLLGGVIFNIEDRA